MAEEGLGLGPAVRDSQRLREVVEVPGYVWMAGAKAGLVDGEGTAAQGLSLGQAVRGLQKRRQVVEVNGELMKTSARSALPMHHQKNPRAGPRSSNPGLVEFLRHAHAAFTSTVSFRPAERIWSCSASLTNWASF